MLATGADELDHSTNHSLGANKLRPRRKDWREWHLARRVPVAGHIA